MIPKLPASTGLYDSLTKSGQAEERTTLPAISLLKIGATVSATVVESKGQNLFMLESADLRLAVQSNLPLTKGQQVHFQVAKTHPVLELQRVEPEISPQIRQALPLAGNSIDVKPLLQQLQSNFFAVAVSTPQNKAGGPPPVLVQTLSTSLSTHTGRLLQTVKPEAIEQLIREGNYTLKGTVIENLGENQNRIRVGNNVFTFHGRTKAQPGEPIVLRLQSLQPIPIFLPVNSNGVVDSTQPLLLNTPQQSLPALIKALQLPLFTGLDLLQTTEQKLLHNLQDLSPGKLQEPGAGEILKRNIEQLGLRSEALVAHGKGREAASQLKSVLAEIVKIFQVQEEISATASRLLATLESSQFVQAKLHNENSLLFPLPFSFLDKAYLMVEQEEHRQETGADEGKDTSFTLHLSLEGLGNIRIKCIQSEDSIRIAFFLDSQEKANFVSTFKDELQGAISSAPLLSLSFADGAESPGTALLQKVFPAEQSILSTSA